MRKVLDDHLAFQNNISHSGFTERLPLMKPVLDASALGGVRFRDSPFPALLEITAVEGCQVSGVVR